MVGRYRQGSYLFYNPIQTIVDVVLFVAWVKVGNDISMCHKLSVLWFNLKDANVCKDFSERSVALVYRTINSSARDNRFPSTGKMPSS